MKIAWITVHRTLNYGTMLQAYACNRILREFGYDTLLVDYYRSKDYRDSSFQTPLSYYRFRKRAADAKNLRERLALALKSAASYRSTKRFHAICDAFLREHLTLTEPYDSSEALKRDPPRADLYCAGSDQIWNTEYNGGIDEAFYLTFAPQGRAKLSFASSIGLDRLTEEDGKRVRELLSEFSAISVREESAKSLLGQLGLVSTAVLDPTLLLDAAQWEQLASKPLLDEPYLLIYKLKGDGRLDRAAHEIARQRKLKIVRLAFGHAGKAADETTVILPEVGEFLSLMKNASFVVTNSFHGACFSINFNRQFLAVTRERYNSRLTNVLEKTGLTDRLLTRDAADATALPDIAFEAVNRRLDAERRNARAWLREALDRSTEG